MRNQPQKPRISPQATPPGANFVREFYTYQEDFSALAASTSAIANVNIQSDSDFVLQKLMYFADIAAAAQLSNSKVVPLCTIVITDSGSGRQLMESAVPIPSLFGSGDLPFILPTPRLFQARSTITITIANFSAATTYNVRLSLCGYKVYRV